MNLAYALELAAHRYPEAEAIVTETERLSYRDLNELVVSVAGGLSGLGVRPGERVAICALNGTPAAAMFFAVHRVGAVAVLLNTRWTYQDMQYSLVEANVSAILYDEAVKEQVRQATAACDHAILRIYTGPDIAGSELSFDELKQRRLARSSVTDGDASGSWTILYTSGTTGKPKGVCRTSLSDYLSALAIILEHRWERFERVLAVMPLCHTMGLHTLISMVLLNGTAFLLPKAHAEVCAGYLEKEVTALYLVPTIYHDLTAFLVAGGHKTAVRKLAYAGAPMSPELIRACFELFRPGVFVNQYGCTEMLAITTNASVSKKPLSAGRPALQTKIRIIAADAGRLVSPSEMLPPGEVGEIIVEAASSPQSFRGYLNNPQATERVLRQGWYFTGDLGFTDKEGDLFLAGRVDDMIITGGENVYPEEVERVLLGHPGVKDVAVVGFPDERWGEKIVAFVVPALQVTGKELEQYCLECAALARFKRPRDYIFIREIPKSPTGKVLRSRLRNGETQY